LTYRVNDGLDISLVTKERKRQEIKMKKRLKKEKGETVDAGKSERKKERDKKETATGSVKERKEKKEKEDIIFYILSKYDGN
jgi:hypothetical protein